MAVKHCLVSAIMPDSVAAAQIIETIKTDISGTFDRLTCLKSQSDQTSETKFNHDDNKSKTRPFETTGECKRPTKAGSVMGA